MAHLDLLGSPVRIRIPHVRWWLDAWDEFQHTVRDTDQGDDAADDIVPCACTHEDGADEDVDCKRYVSGGDLVDLAIRPSEPFRACLG